MNITKEELQKLISSDMLLIKSNYDKIPDYVGIVKNAIHILTNNLGGDITENLPSDCFINSSHKLFFKAAFRNAGKLYEFVDGDVIFEWLNVYYTDYCPTNIGILMDNSIDENNELYMKHFIKFEI